MLLFGQPPAEQGCSACQPAHALLCRSAQLQRLDILLNGQPVDALARVVHRQALAVPVNPLLTLSIVSDSQAVSVHKDCSCGLLGQRKLLQRTLLPLANLSQSQSLQTAPAQVSRQSSYLPLQAFAMRPATSQASVPSSFPPLTALQQQDPGSFVTSGNGVLVVVAIMVCSPAVWACMR